MSTIQDLQQLRTKYLEDNVVYWALTLAISAKLGNPVSGLEKDIELLKHAIADARNQTSTQNGLARP